MSGSMIQIGINGYGTIGKRVADAVRDQPDMDVMGIAKASPNHTAEYARRQGYSLYIPTENRANHFAEAGVETAGLVDELVAESDVIVDATPAGMGAQYRELYEEYDTPAIFQGGEEADVAPVSFTARANFSDAIGADSIRVVSCNTTGLNRLFAPLQEVYGVEKVCATLVRCRGDISDILPDPITPPSHHAPDVQAVLPDIDIQTLGMKVPATRHHFHSLNITLEDTPSAEQVRDRLSDESRLRLIDEHLDIDGTGALREYALDRGRPRGDLWENRIWSESVVMDGKDLYLFQSIHRESDVVPENIDAIRAITGVADASESIEMTNEALGIGNA